MVGSVDSSFAAVDIDHLAGNYAQNVVSQSELEAYIMAEGGGKVKPEDAKKIAEYIMAISAGRLQKASDKTVGFSQIVWDGGMADYVAKVVGNFIENGSVYLVPLDEEGLCAVDYGLAFCLDADQDGTVSEAELQSFIKAVKPELTDDQATTLASKVFDQLNASSSGDGRFISTRLLGQTSQACKLSLLLNVMDNPEQVAASNKYSDSAIKEILFPLIDTDGSKSISRSELKDYYISHGKTPAEADALVTLHFSKLNDKLDGGISIDELTVPKKILSGNVKAYDYVAPKGALTTNSLFTAMDTDLDGVVDKSEATSYYLTKFNNDPAKAKTAVDSVFGSINSGQANNQKLAKLNLSQFKEGGGLNLMNMMESVVNGSPKELYAKQADGGVAKWDAATKTWKDVKDETWQDYLASNQGDAAYSVDTGAAVAVVIGDASDLGVPKLVPKIKAPVVEPPMQGDYFIKVGDSYLGVKKQGEGDNAYYDVFEYDSSGTLKSSYTGDPHVDEDGDGKHDWHFSEGSSFVLSNGATVSFTTEQWRDNANVKVIDAITVSTGAGSVTYDSDTV